MDIPGDAITILENTTLAMAFRAAAFDSPILFPSSSVTGIPLNNSVCRIRGMFTQFAAATAANGTNLPIKGGADLVRWFNPRATATAPVVANASHCQLFICYKRVSTPVCIVHYCIK